MKSIRSKEKSKRGQSEGAKYYKKYLDVGKNSILSNRAGVKTIEVNQLTFEATEELFSNSVVIGIILTRHDLPEVKL